MTVLSFPNSSLDPKFLRNSLKKKLIFLNEQTESLFVVQYSEKTHMFNLC